MMEFSEKEIEERYKDIKLGEVPSLWDEIESNLAPKNKIPDEKKIRRFPIHRFASIAAVLLVAVILIPTLYTITQKKSQDMTNQEMGTAEMSTEELSGEFAENAMDMAPEVYEEKGTAQEKPAAEQEGVESMEPEMYSNEATKMHITIEVIEVTEEEQGIRIYASNAESEEMLEILYEGEEYHIEDFGGTMEVIVSSGKEIKLFQILP